MIMGFYDKAFDNSLQAKAAGSKPILFPANQNLGRSGLIILRDAFPCARPLSIAHQHVVHIAGLNQFSWSRSARFSAPFLPKKWLDIKNSYGNPPGIMLIIKNGTIVRLSRLENCQEITQLTLID